MMNPMMLVQQMMTRNPGMQSNPMMQNALQMAQNGNVQGLQALAQNLCKEKGLNLNDVQRQVMQQLGMK